VEGGEETDEIALNPSTFRSRSTEETLSTLVHEMCHLWQFHKGGDCDAQLEAEEAA